MYKTLLALVNEDESFYRKEMVLEDQLYNIFNYRLASWAQFQKPGALDCRGTMFNVTDVNNPVLVSLPPQKFFNYEEGVIDHTLCIVGTMMDKLDGSLISTYLHKGQLRLKSKADLFSSQAIAAMTWLDLEENRRFKSELLLAAEEGTTINLEYTSPTNRIVVPYSEDKLTILSVRNHTTGGTLFGSELRNYLMMSRYSTLIDKLVHYQDLYDSTWLYQVDQSTLVSEIRKEKKGEGYVIEMVREDCTSYLVKVKNLAYIQLHQSKDSIQTPSKLFALVVNELSDDIRSAFADDAWVLAELSKMEDMVIPKFNHLVKTVEDFYEENKGLGRKEYAIKANTEHHEVMGLMMNLYIGRENNYKEFVIKQGMSFLGLPGEEFLPTIIED
ncbi:MAG: T4 RnlA family RNA ligase [Ignisphaera sp.]|nr:T4 RnlA family RNA ligase [Ignisphaera sp.]